VRAGEGLGKLLDIGGGYGIVYSERGRKAEQGSAPRRGEALRARVH